MKAVFERLSPRQRSYAAAAGIALVSLGAGYGLSMLGGGSDGGGDAASDTGCEEVLYWYDPMVPDQRFDEPGKSPFMDMQLVPKCAGGDAQAGEGVSIDSGMVQNFGIRTAEAEYGVLEPETTVTGTLAYNGSEVAIVQPRAGGYVQRTYGHAPQDLIARGAPVVDLLVPYGAAPSRNFLPWRPLATRRLPVQPPAPSIARDAGRRDLLGGSKQDPIDDTVTAPQSGAITSLGVRPGMTVMAGQPRRNQRLQSDLRAAVPGPCGKRPRGTAGKRDAHRFSWRAICRADHCHPAECTGGKPDDYRARGDAQPRPSPETGHVCAGHDRS